MIPKTIKHENWFNEQDEWCNNKIFMFTCVTTMACTKRWLKKELIWKEPSLKCKNIKKKIERGDVCITLWSLYYNFHIFFLNQFEQLDDLSQAPLRSWAIISHLHLGSPSCNNTCRSTSKHEIYYRSKLQKSQFNLFKNL